MEHECGVYRKVESIVFDITHWLTSESNELHSTAITFYGLIWIENNIYSFFFF